MATGTNDLAAAWGDALARLCDAAPGGWCKAHGDALALVSGAGMASLNVAFSTVPDPGPSSREALEEAAADVARAGVPWCLIVRGPASDPVIALAARHGLVRQGKLPLMACPATRAELDVDPALAGQVRPVSGAVATAYTSTLYAGFEAPPGVFGSVMGSGTLDAPGFTGYLAEADGSPQGTGFGVQGDGVIGVFNISVVPAARRRGLGRAITARVLTDGFAAGARTAYLNPSAVAQPLYEAMGFRVAEAWTVFTASNLIPNGCVVPVAAQ